MAIFAQALNLFDLIATLIALKIGAEETNPLMQSVIVMVLYKGLVIPMLIWLVSRIKNKTALIGLRLCVVVYSAVCVWHIYCFIRILFIR